jgi:hypothetical protein
MSIIINGEFKNDVPRESTLRSDTISVPEKFVFEYANFQGDILISGDELVIAALMNNWADYKRVART